MRFSHILKAQKFECEDLLKKIDEGSDFADLAKVHSTCPSAKQGGDLGKVSLARLDPDFTDVARDLAVGEISHPVRTRFGYHLILRTE